MELDAQIMLSGIEKQGVSRDFVHVSVLRGIRKHLNEEKKLVCKSTVVRMCHNRRKLRIRYLNLGTICLVRY